MAKRKDELIKDDPKNLPALGADEFAGDTGAGLENTRPEEQKPAFLYLFQENAKAVNKRSGEHVEGAEPGMFYSTGTGRVFERVEFIALHRKTSYIEWIKIEDGGGFVAEHDPDGEFVRSLIRTDRDRFRKVETEDGHQLAQTQTIFALAGPPDFTLSEAELVAIPFTSIKIRHYTGWFDASKRLAYTVDGGRIVHPDIYRHRWLLTSEFEQKWKPNGAFNVRIALAGATKEAALVRTSDLIYVELKKLFDERDKLRADYSKERQPGDDADEIPM